jgi:hypothetical protein
LAGRSASSGLSGILSIRPRGRSHPSSPKGTQTRPAPTGAWRVVVRRMIGPAGKGCQTWPRRRWSRDRSGAPDENRPFGTCPDAALRSKL